MILRRHVKMLLREVPPGAVCAYLRAKGWAVNHDREAKDGMVWERAPRWVVVPVSRTFRNYPRRLAKLVGYVGYVEHRNAWEVLFDLLNVPRCPDNGEGCGSYNVRCDAAPYNVYDCMDCGILFTHNPFYPVWYKDKDKESTS